MKKYLNVRGKLLDCSTPLVMGIINITPDSFYNAGNFENDRDLQSYAHKMISDGASIIDIGSQSTRPGAEIISANEEWSRLNKALPLLRKTFPSMVLSVDTFYAEVAEKAVGEGADIINDVSGGSMDARMFETIGRLKVPYVLMHIQGTPKTMQQNPQYDDIINEVLNYFTEQIRILESFGVTDIIIDPGFGFGKTANHNFELLSNFNIFKIFGRPLVAGISRKSMINKVLGTMPENALNGTTVLHTILLQKGVNILRVHDVNEAVEAIKLSEKVGKL